MADGPTHFLNQNRSLLVKGLCTEHHFTAPYCPWSESSIERLGKKLLRSSRSIISEVQVRLDSWPDLITMKTSIINNCPSPQRNNITPITNFSVCRHQHQSMPSLDSPSPSQSRLLQPSVRSRSIRMSSY